MHDDSLDEVVELELALLHPDVRRDRPWVEDLLDEDFREIGASGRLWSRQETIDGLAGEQDDGPVAVADMEALQLADGLVLVTYVSDRAGRRARRSRSGALGWSLAAGAPPGDSCACPPGGTQRWVTAGRRLSRRPAGVRTYESLVRCFGTATRPVIPEARAV